MKSDDFLARIERDSEQINFCLRDNLQSHVQLIAKVGNHILLAGGKRLRPILFVESSRMCHYNGGREYYFSTVFEYIHAATLLHDDVIDRAATRRGRESANMVWDNSAAVLVGDFLYSKSFNMAVEMGNFEILDVISSTTNRMAEGMVLELIHTHNLDMTEEQYLEVIVSKTAVLMAAAARVGGMLGVTTPEQQRALENFGMDLGIAFQMVDDALDYTLSEKEFGKPVGKDIEEGKITLPFIHTLRSLPEPEAKRLRDMTSRDSYRAENFPEVCELVRKQGGIEETLARARAYADSAVGYLDAFPDCEHKDLMLELADFVIYRKL
jgi:octaprenyl-diphosphate synthase